jgi:hypothetical protein
MQIDIMLNVYVDTLKKIQSITKLVHCNRFAVMHVIWNKNVDTHFTSTLTNKNYFTRTYGDLNCKSANVVYGLECNLCGLVYFGETKGKLRNRICGHRSGIITNVNDIVYQHFTAIVMDIVGHRPFKLDRIKKNVIDKRSFLRLVRQQRSSWH